MPKDQSYFSYLDYRNAKFQGHLTNGQPDGVGIVIDDEFNMALTSWKGNIPTGPTLIVFPNRNYLFGKFRNQ